MSWLYSGHLRPLLGNVSELLRSDSAFTYSYLPSPPRSALEDWFGLYRVFKSPDINDLCKIWEVLCGDGKERVRTRDTREGWTLLTFESEVNGDSICTNERSPSMDSSCWYNLFLSCLGCSSQSNTKYYFPHSTLFHFISPPSPSNLGRQACWVAWLRLGHSCSGRPVAGPVLYGLPPLWLELIMYSYLSPLL
jgi:hypothetical protein